MTFEPLDLLNLAETLDRTAEAQTRTVINRAYYAVFLKARDNLRARKLMAGRGGGQEHGEVIHTLKSNYRVTAGNQLSSLRDKREMADYDTGKAISEADGVQALQIAREVKRSLAADWGVAPE